MKLYKITTDSEVMHEAPNSTNRYEGEWGDNDLYDINYHFETKKEAEMLIEKYGWFNCQVVEDEKI